jgi:RNA polymerase sigma-70 factor (ECF subfamily)
MEAANLTETEIIRHILLGKKNLYEILIRRMNPVLFKIGRSYGFNHPEVQDLMQETYINAYLNLGQFSARSSFKTWIIRIMLNQCYHKKNKWLFKNMRLSDNMNEDSKPLFSGNPESAESKLTNSELNRIIEAALMNIPVEYRIVFCLREINGLNVAETAEAIEITETNVKARYSRAKKMLRSEITKFYKMEEIFEFNLIYCNDMVNRVMSKLKN